MKLWARSSSLPCCSLLYSLILSSESENYNEDDHDYCHPRSCLAHLSASTINYTPPIAFCFRRAGDYTDLDVGCGIPCVYPGYASSPTLYRYGASPSEVLCSTPAISNRINSDYSIWYSVYANQKLLAMLLQYTEQHNQTDGSEQKKPMKTRSNRSMHRSGVH